MKMRNVEWQHHQKRALEQLEKNTGIAQPILDYEKKMKNPTVDYLECYCFRLRHER